MNGPQKRVCRVENMLIGPGQTNFRCTVTNFMQKKSYFLYFSENLQNSIKSDASDTNGPQKRVCRVENILIDPGETDFRCTVTNFMKKNIFLSHNSYTEAAIS